MCANYTFTLNDCYEIVQHHMGVNDFQIVDFQEKSLAKHVIGMMGDHYKLEAKIRFKDKIVTKTFFVKRMQSPHGVQTRMMQQQGAYKKEHFAYTTLCALFDSEPGYSRDYMARCYFTVKDGLFVFEDLGEFGYTVHRSGSHVLDLEHLRLALSTAAKFHAGSIIYETKRSISSGMKYKLTDEYSEYFEDSMYRKNSTYLGEYFYRTCIRSVVALIDKVPYFETNKNEIKKRFLMQVENVYGLVTASDKFRNVVCHGDLWVSNLMFKYNNDVPVHCKILDFQALRYTVPAHDFLSLVHSNSKEFSSEDDNLKRHYYNSLKICLDKCNIDINDHMTYQQFLDSIEYMLPFIIIQTACFSTICVTRFDENIQKDSELYTKYLYEDRTEICLKAYEENQIFKDIINDALKDLDKL